MSILLMISILLGLSWTGPPSVTLDKGAWMECPDVYAYWGPKYQVRTVGYGWSCLFAVDMTTWKVKIR